MQPRVWRCVTWVPSCLVASPTIPQRPPAGKCMLSPCLPTPAAQESGGRVEARPSSEGGRESLFRAGVHAALNAAREASGSGPIPVFGGATPPGFVVALANALGVTPARAVTLAHGALAATLRGLIVDAESAYRRSAPAEGAAAISQLLRLLRVFPMPRGASQVELVAGSLQGDLAARHAILQACTDMEPSLAPQVADLLGITAPLADE